MTSEQANELHRIYRRGRESGLSDAQIESLLMLVDVVDWEQQKFNSESNHCDRTVFSNTETAIEGASAC